MEIKIENNIAILSDGETIRRIDLSKDYMREVDDIIAELENKLSHYKKIKKEIYEDQKIILEYLLNREER